MKSLTHRIDHTLLKPEATPHQIVALCAQAKAFGFFSVCINPCFVELAKQELLGSTVQVVTVIGFPLGATLSSCKSFETTQVVQKGAAEVDMVMNIGAAKAGAWIAVENDIRAVVAAADGRPVKVILETCLLSSDEKIASCQAALRGGAQFVKTSTGFSTGGATEADVRLLRATVGKDFGVKASGGMKSLADLEKMIAAGANRLGTSAAVEILQSQATAGQY